MLLNVFSFVLSFICSTLVPLISVFNDNFLVAFDNVKGLIEKNYKLKEKKHDISVINLICSLLADIPSS